MKLKNKITLKGRVYEAVTYCTQIKTDVSKTRYKPLFLNELKTSLLEDYLTTNF